MAYGLGYLRLNPTCFWQMSLQEFHVAISYDSSTRGLMSSSALEEMMRHYPDN